VLKGDSFTERVRAICADLPEPQPLAHLKYRRILIPGLLGGEIQFSLLGFLGHAMRIRGAEVTGLLCDEFLPACTMKKVDHYESACKRWCFKNSGPFVRAARLPHRWYSEFVRPDEVEDCARTAQRLPTDALPAFEWRGVNLGVHVDRSVESYFRVGAFDLDNAEMVAKARELLTSAMYLTLIGERVLDELEIDKVFMEDGLKIDWGVIREVARRRGIPVDVIVAAPRGDSILVGRDRDSEICDAMPDWEWWKDVPSTAEEEAELAEYFERRAIRPYEDLAWFDISPLETASEIRQQVGLPAESTGLMFGMFPNLGCDSGVTTDCPAYDTAAEWVAESVRFFARYPQHHLVVKVHPAETCLSALDPTVDYLAATFGRLPPNIHVLPPDTSLTAHDVVSVLDIAMVYTSTVGIEAACLGKPVINVGGGRHARRGFTVDAASPLEYVNLLRAICAGRIMPLAETELARRYAYTLFFRCALPNRIYSALYPNLAELRLDSLEDLTPGREPAVDIITRGVLLDEPFCNTGPSLWHDD